MVGGDERAVPHAVSATGPREDFQEVLDDVVVRLIQRLPGATGEHVRGALRGARTTESIGAYLALVRGHAAWNAWDEDGLAAAVAEALELDPAYADPHRKLLARAALERHQGDQAVDALQEAARLHAEAGRVHEQAKAMLRIGRTRVEQGAWDDGVAAYEEAAALFEGQGAVRGWVQARMNVAGVLLRRGDFEGRSRPTTRGWRRSATRPKTGPGTPSTWGWPSRRWGATTRRSPA